MPDDKKLTTIFVVRFWYPSKRKKLLYYQRVFGHIRSIENGKPMVLVQTKIDLEDEASRDQIKLEEL